MNRIWYLVATLALLNASGSAAAVATAVSNFDAGPADTAASTVQRGPRVAKSRAELSPPLFLLPEPRGGPQAHVKHPVRRNPNLAPAPAAPDPVLQSTLPLAPTGMVPLLDFFGQGDVPPEIDGTPKLE
jgi:hypothetical protein